MLYSAHLNPVGKELLKSYVANFLINPECLISCFLVDYILLTYICFPFIINLSDIDYITFSVRLPK